MPFGKVKQEEKMAHPKHGSAKWFSREVSGFATSWKQGSGIFTLQVWGPGEVISPTDEQSGEPKGDTMITQPSLVSCERQREGERAISRPEEWPLQPLALNYSKR